MLSYSDKIALRQAHIYLFILFYFTKGDVSIPGLVQMSVQDIDDSPVRAMRTGTREPFHSRRERRDGRRERRDWIKEMFLF